MDDHIRPLKGRILFFRLLSFTDRDGIRDQRKPIDSPKRQKERKDSPWQKKE